MARYEEKRGQEKFKPITVKKTRARIRTRGLSARRLEGQNAPKDCPRKRGSAKRKEPRKLGLFVPNKALWIGTSRPETG